jgi:ADP-ribose pyrophosphatase YjhB (NUDIX family)
MRPRRRLSAKEFAFIFRRVPRLCVDVVTRDRRGVVLVKRDIAPDRGRWNFPGGTVRRGERLLDAVRRFAREECGLRVEIGRIIGAIEFFGRPKNPHIVSIAFLCRPNGGRLRGSWQGREVRFFRTLPQNIVPEDRRFLAQNRLAPR